jgi:hypothetical protein
LFVVAARQGVALDRLSLHVDKALIDQRLQLRQSDTRPPPQFRGRHRAALIQEQPQCYGEAALPRPLQVLDCGFDGCVRRRKRDITYGLRVYSRSGEPVGALDEAPRRQLR